MVEEQIVRRGIRDSHVINALRRVPRHEFIDKKDIHLAYRDNPVAIGEGQTISQPYMVALMTETLQLKKTDHVLEVGTGCGYQTAVLAELSAHVYSTERIPVLAGRAQDLLGQQGYKNVTIRVSDGTLGWTGGISFDAIIVTAAAPGPVPEHSEPVQNDKEKTVIMTLLSQLKDGGRLIVPVGTRESQMLTRLVKQGARLKVEDLCPCVFVPLLGKRGWPA